MEAKEPAPRGAVKVRVATAKRLDLDGGHGAGVRRTPIVKPHDARHVPSVSRLVL